MLGKKIPIERTKSTIIAAITNPSKPWRSGLWKHLSCITCQKGHTQQVIIPLEYVVIICNLHCTAVGMFVPPSKKHPPLPCTLLTHLITMHLHICGKWARMLCINTNAEAYVGLLVSQHILFCFQWKKVVKNSQWALKRKLASKWNAGSRALWKQLYSHPDILHWATG